MLCGALRPARGRVKSGGLFAAGESYLALAANESGRTSDVWRTIGPLWKALFFRSLGKILTGQTTLTGRRGDERDWSYIGPQGSRRALGGFPALHLYAYQEASQLRKAERERFPRGLCHRGRPGCASSYPMLTISPSQRGSLQALSMGRQPEEPRREKRGCRSC